MYGMCVCVCVFVLGRVCMVSVVCVCVCVGSGSVYIYFYCILGLNIKETTNAIYKILHSLQCKISFKCPWAVIHIYLLQLISNQKPIILLYFAQYLAVYS